MTTTAVIAIVSILVTFLLAIGSHIFVSVWWASKITTTLGFLRESLQKIEKHQDGYYPKEDAIKEFALVNARIEGIGKKLDELRTRVETLEREVAFIKGGQAS